MSGIERLHAHFAGPGLPRGPSGIGPQDRAECYLAALRRRASTLRVLFWIVIVLPAAAVYYGLIASKNMYRKLNLSFEASQAINPRVSALY